MLCEIENCGRPVKGQGWCRNHYQNWYRTGNPLGYRRTDADRFWAKVTKTDGCWIWTGAKMKDGYGNFRDADMRNVRAHCWAYAHEVGPIPEGFEVDHTCRNIVCVRPTHLEAVTGAENQRRATEARRRERQAA